MTQRDAWVLYKVGACCHLPPAAFCHGKLSNNEEICLDLCDFAQSDLGNAGNSRTRAFSLCANFMKGANMLDIANKKEITKVARAVERALGAKGIVLSHGEVLNILAQAHGYKDYNAWKASLSPSRIDKLLTPAELAHVACSDGVEYGNEGVVRTSNGFELRFDAQDEEGTSYVRVCDPLGREIAYWVENEWAEEPRLVMGAILNCLTRGKSQEKRVGDKQSKTKAFRISDVDFSRIHAVVYQGSQYQVVQRSDSCLSYLGKEHLPDYEEFLDETCFVLHREEDGLTWEEDVTLGLLASLQWDAQRKAFVDPQGHTWRFFLEQEFGNG